MEELWTNLLLVAVPVTVVALAAYLATRAAPTEDISPQALSEVLGKRDGHGHPTHD